jgi:alkylhydroperoxidase/carboxymuconolactone decarboxylase family protein YurZ
MMRTHDPSKGWRSVAWFQDVLRHLAVNDRAMVAELHAPGCAGIVDTLDARELALARVASLVATDGSVATFRWTVGDALEAGVSPEKIVGVLLAVAPLVGFARVATTAPKIAIALDYDIEDALEVLEP